MFFFFFKQKTAYEIGVRLVGSEMCIRDSVNTVKYAGKNKSRYTKAGIINGRTNAFKKAIVTLKEGDTIDFYSNI